MQHHHVAVAICSLVLMEQADRMANLVGSGRGAAAFGGQVDPLLASDHADIGAAVAGRDAREAHEVRLRAAFNERDDGLVVPFRDRFENDLPLLDRYVAVDHVRNATVRPPVLVLERRAFASYRPGRGLQHGSRRTSVDGSERIGPSKDHVAGVDRHCVDDPVRQFHAAECCDARTMRLLALSRANLGAGGRVGRGTGGGQR